MCALLRGIATSAQERNVRFDVVILGNARGAPYAIDDGRFRHGLPAFDMSTRASANSFAERWMEDDSDVNSRSVKSRELIEFS